MRARQRAGDTFAEQGGFGLRLAAHLRDLRGEVRIALGDVAGELGQGGCRAAFDPVSFGADELAELRDFALSRFDAGGRVVVALILVSFGAGEHGAHLGFAIADALDKRFAGLDQSAGRVGEGAVEQADAGLCLGVIVTQAGDLAAQGGAQVFQRRFLLVRAAHGV